MSALNILIYNLVSLYLECFLQINSYQMTQDIGQNCVTLNSHKLKSNKFASKFQVAICVKHNSQCYLVPEFSWFSVCVLQKDLFVLISFRSRVLSVHRLTYTIIPRTFILKQNKKKTGKAVTSWIRAASSTLNTFFLRA